MADDEISFDDFEEEERTYTLITNEDGIYVGKAAVSIEDSDELEPYTKVVLTAYNGTTVEAGTDDGRTLNVDCIYVNSTVANNILTQINGYKYHPFEVDSAIADPAVEIGDLITADSVYGVICSMNKTFGRMILHDFKADYDGDVDNEFPWAIADTYATYQSLSEGTAEVNGSGLISGTVAQTTFTSDTSTKLDDAKSDSEYAKLNVDQWIAGTGATFGGIDASSLNVSGIMYYYPNSGGGGPVYIDSTGRLYVNSEVSLSSE